MEKYLQSVDVESQMATHHATQPHNTTQQKMAMCKQLETLFKSLFKGKIFRKMF